MASILDKNSDRKLFLSFSMGKSSFKMVEDVLDDCMKGLRSYSEIAIITANTGLEDPLSLEFGRQCDEYWKRKFGIGITLVESVVDHGHRKGTTHKVVSFDTAHQGGDLMEEVIKKYGIPNKYYMHCTRELKERAMYSYVKSVLKWEQGCFDVAIGIRGDEPKRINGVDENFRKTAKGTMGATLIYPLAQNNTDQAAVFEFCLAAPFQLLIPEHRGNCIGCHKKSDKKICTILSEDPNALDLWDDWSKEHGMSGARKEGNTEPRKFFRPASKDRPGLRTAAQMLEDAKNYEGELYEDEWMKLVANKNAESFAV